MKKVFKFVKGKKEDKKECGGITPSQSGDLISPAQTPEDERFLGLENSSGYIVDFCGKDKTLTKLHKAAWQGSLEKLKSALKKIDIDTVDRHNRTALHFAVVQGHPNIVWFLLGNNAKATIADDEGHTPLLKAIECGHRECMNLLLERGADVNVADYTGNTGLHVAAKQDSLDTLLTLLNKGADTEVSNNAGDYPLHIATKLQNKDLVDALLNAGASVDVLDRRNRTPLMLAATTGNMSLVQLFVEKGAQLKIVDSNGWTAEDYALFNGHENVTALLKDLKRKKEEKPGESTREKIEEPPQVKSNENSESCSDNPPGSSSIKDPITKKLKEFFKKCSEEEEKEKQEDSPDSPNAEVMPPYCQPPRSWDMIQAGMIDNNNDGAEPKRRSITTLGTLHSRRESFSESLGNTSPKYTLSLNRRKVAKVNNSFAKQRFSFNEEESLKNWIKEDKSIRKDLEKIELENMLNIESSETPNKSSSKIRDSTSESEWESDLSLPPDNVKEEKKSETAVPPDPVSEFDSTEPEEQSKHSNSGTLGRSGTMQGIEEIWVTNSQLYPPKTSEEEKLNSWDSEETSIEKEGNFPPPPTALELGVDMAKSIKYMKGVSEDHPMGSVFDRNLWKNAYESHSLDCLDEKDSSESSKSKPFKGHFRHQSTSAQKWGSEEITKSQKPRDRLADINKRISEQLECYDQALRELAESSRNLSWSNTNFESTSGSQNYHSLPNTRGKDHDETRGKSRNGKEHQKLIPDSGPHSAPCEVSKLQDVENNETLGPEKKQPSESLSPRNLEKPSEEDTQNQVGDKMEKKTKRHILLAMRDVKHAVHVTNTFKTSLDDQILSPLTKPEDSFEIEDKLSPKAPSSGSGGTSPADENPFFGLGRQETVMERNEFRRKSSSSGTGDDSTLWLQDEVQGQNGRENVQCPGSDEDISEISGDKKSKHQRTSSFSPLGIIYQEIQRESSKVKDGLGDVPLETGEKDISFFGERHLTDFNGEDEEQNQEIVREQSPDISLSSGPIEPLGTEKDSGSEPESSHNDVTPTHHYSLKAQHEWLKSHLKTATSEKNKLEEIAAQLSEKAERLQYELADAKEAAKSRDEVIHLLQSQLAKMEAAYTKSLEESIQSRLQLTSHEQEILHLKELCFKYEEEERESFGTQDLEYKIKALEEEKEKMRKEINHLEKEKSSLEKRLKEISSDPELLEQCQRWKERFEKLEEENRDRNQKVQSYESSIKEINTENVEREKRLKEKNSELEHKILEISQENIELKAKLQSLVSEVESERRKTPTKMEMKESVEELKIKNMELEVHLKRLEKELEERNIKKLKGREEEVQELLKQFSKERESLIMSYEKKLMEKRSEESEREIEGFRKENERLKQMVKVLQGEIVEIRKQASEDTKESLKSELCDLKDQCCEVTKSIVEIKNKDQEELNFLMRENFKLKGEMNELKVKMMKDDGEVPNFKTELLGIVGENTKMKNEILVLKSQVNALSAMLEKDRRLLLDYNKKNESLERKIQKGLERRQSQKSEIISDQKLTRKREVDKEDELAWSSLYGIKSSGRVRGERSSVSELLMRNSESDQEDESNGKTTEIDVLRRLKSEAEHQKEIEFLELRKELLCLQNRMSDEKALRHSLESRIAEINYDLKEKQNLEREIYSLKKKIDRDCVRKSEMELLQYQKKLELEREELLKEKEVKTTDEDYKLKCEMLAKERQKIKEMKKEMWREWKSTEPEAKPPTSTFPLSPVKFNSYPQTLPEFLMEQPRTDSLGPEIKNKLEEELERSIRKHTNESSSTQSISAAQIGLLKKKYLH